MIFLAVLGLLVAGPAAAHGTLPGGGGFYSGAAHPLLALDHLLALLAGGLVLGRGEGGRRVLPALAAGLASGLAAGLWFGSGGPGVRLVLLALTLGFGGLLALQIRLPAWACGPLFAGLGWAVGVDTDLPEAEAQAAIIGLAVAVFLIVLNAMALGSVLTRPFGVIALRVAGAWMFAVALMVLALQIRGLA